MGKKIIFGLFCCYFLGIYQGVHANIYIQKKVLGHTIKVIKYDLKSKDYTFKFGMNLDYNATSLRKLMENNNGISAVNGVFFCPESYNECGGKNFTHNERYQHGIKISGTGTGNYRVLFALDKDNKPFLYQNGLINGEKENDIQDGLSNFPLLLENGEKKIQNYIDAGLIDAKMKINISRNFICSDKNERYIYTGYIYNINLENIGDVLLELGCYNALNLDAGGSSAMIYNARHIIGPGRDIMDGIIIERTDLDTQRIRNITDRLMKKIENKLSKYKYNTKLKYLDKVSQGLTHMRIQLYEKNSVDIFDEYGKIIGYKIHMEKIKNLETVYLINYLNVEINELKQKYIQKELEENPKIIEYTM